MSAWPGTISQIFRSGFFMAVIMFPSWRRHVVHQEWWAWDCDSWSLCHILPMDPKPDQSRVQVSQSWWVHFLFKFRLCPEGLRKHPPAGGPARRITTYGLIVYILGSLIILHPPGLAFHIPATVSNGLRGSSRRIPSPNPPPSHCLQRESDRPQQ